MVRIRALFTTKFVANRNNTYFLVSETNMNICKLSSQMPANNVSLNADDMSKMQ